MKILKTIGKAILSLAAVLVIVFLLGRYGWKVMGFKACNGAGIEDVVITEQNVHIKGFYPGSFPSGFIGYVSEEEDGRLYVGYRFSGVFGIFETGNFEIDIPVHSDITEIYTKTGTDEYLVWPR